MILQRVLFGQRSIVSGQSRPYHRCHSLCFRLQPLPLLSLTKCHVWLGAPWNRRKAISARVCAVKAAAVVLDSKMTTTQEWKVVDASACAQGYSPKGGPDSGSE